MNPNDDKKGSNYEIHSIKIGGFPLDFLPPDLLDKIQQDLMNSNGLEAGGNNSTSDDKKEEKPVAKPKKIKYDYSMVSCNQDLKTLTEKLKASKITKYGMLLWGVSGSGKSYYGQYLAQELGMPLLKKRASDLIDKWVGGTEKNIREAFKEAKEKKAILLLDEADSFLFDRRHAKQDFQAASVNEVLVQMEDHPYPMIMTTNLKDKIDKAALRRFIFKIKYDYMEASHVQAGVKTYFGAKYKLSTEQLNQLTHLCAGDFKVVKEKIDILEDGQYSTDIIFEYLLHELKEKEIETGSTKIEL